MGTYPGTGTGTGNVYVGGQIIPSWTVQTTDNVTTTVPTLQGYLGGLQLSNDGANPNTIIDITAGLCADSNAVTYIQLGAFTKSTGGSWAAGTGNNGMGTGLTIANSTWYHVFAIINGGAADVYFDTSVSAANAPSGTTAYRRIGSFKTDSSSNILAFTQNGDEFLWKTPASDASAVATSTVAASRTLSVPTGVEVWAIFNGALAFSSGTSAVLFYPLDMGTQAAGVPAGYADLYCNVVTVSVATGYFQKRTNTSAQIGVVASGSGGTYYIVTYGWIDRRGRDT